MTRYGARFGPAITFLGVDPVDLVDALRDLRVLDAGPLLEGRLP